MSFSSGFSIPSSSSSFLWETIKYRKDGTLPDPTILSHLANTPHANAQQYYQFIVQFLGELPFESCRLKRDKIMLRFFTQLCSIAETIDCPEIQRIHAKLPLVVENIEKYISDVDGSMKDAFTGLSDFLNSYTNDGNDFDIPDFLACLRCLMPEFALSQQPIVQKIIDSVSTMPKLPYRICRLEHSANFVRELLDAMRQSDDVIVLEFVPRFEKFHFAQNECLNSLREDYIKLLEIYAVVLSRWVRGIPDEFDYLHLLSHNDDSGNYASPNAPLLQHIRSVFEALPEGLSDYDRINHGIIVIKDILVLSNTVLCQVPHAMQPFELLQNTLQRKLEDVLKDLLTKIFVMRAVHRRNDDDLD
jgi:hypothetical protein